MIPCFGLVIMLGLGAFFYKAAEFEDLSYPVAWGGASILLYLAAGYWLHWGFCAMLSLQAGLFLCMAVAIHRTTGRGGLSFGDLRKQYRRKRGLCPECGYDLRGVKRPGGCPECRAKAPADGAKDSGPRR